MLKKYSAASFGLWVRLFHVLSMRRAAAGFLMGIFAITNRAGL